MKIFNKISKIGLLLTVVAMSFSACNKLELDPVPNPIPVQQTSPTLATLLDDTSFSLLKAAVTKAGLMPTLANPGLRFTLFAPDDNAISASLAPILPPGVTPAIYINNVLSEADALSLISYHVIPQVIGSRSIATSFPNFQYPSILNPAPSLSALLRLTTFPSVRPNGAWVNNIPITAVDVLAVNGVLHKVARVVSPPSKDLWYRINTDTDLTYLKAVIQRADSGVARGRRLVDALSLDSNGTAIGSNLTIFAPTDAAMKAFLVGAITQALVGQGLPLATAQGQATFLVGTYGTLILTNPYALSPVLGAAITPALAKGIVSYHIISKQSGTFLPPGIRIFSVNMPTAPTAVKTLVNAGVPSHPGVLLQATFVPGQPFVGAITVKGAANASASNVIISSTPPFSSDLHQINGVIHKIDQVLLPQ